ncbi:MAG: hypothetical protein ACJ72N_06220 [Labedaea sp.]
MFTSIVALILTASSGVTSAPNVDHELAATRRSTVVRPYVAVKKPAKVTFTQRVDAAVAKVPGASSATWIVQDRGAWGATDLGAGIVYIAPRTPAGRVLDVVRHEWVHVQQGRVYGGIAQARTALAPWGGVEIVADCGAKALGATWTNYIKRCSPAQTAAARNIIAGRPA